MDGVASPPNSMLADTQRVVGCFVSHMLAQLEAAGDDVDALAAAVNGVVAVFMSSEDPAAPEPTAPAAAQLLHAHAAATGWPAMRTCFYAAQYQTWAGAVLSVATASDDASRSAGGRELQRLVDATFMAAPAVEALSALCGHLSLVSPATQHATSVSGHWPWAPGGATVEALGTGAALRLLRQRFAAPGSTGVAEVVRAHAVDLSPQQADGVPPGAARLRQWSPAAEQSAGHLASLPDRVQHLRGVPAELGPRQYIPHLVRCALEEAAAAAVRAGCAQQLPNESEASDQRVLSHSRASTSAGAAPPSSVGVADAAPAPPPSSPTPDAPAAAFASMLLGRLLLRGHTRMVVSEAVRLAWCEGGVGPQVLRALLLHMAAEPAVLEALLPELLLQLSVRGGGAASTSAAPAPEPGNGTASAALRQLRQVVTAEVLAAPGARYVLTEKLLLQRTLPTPALQLLLAFLDATVLLQPAAGALAAAWADADGILTRPLPQQAYVTQALLDCLTLLPAGGFSVPGGGAAAAAPGVTALVPALLQGVSARLGSPRPAVRAQGMRVGRSLAQVLDPSKPLFEDQGSLELTREELWPGARPRASRPPPHAPADPAPAADAAAGNGASAAAAAEGPARPGSALARLREASAQPDSDDDDAGSGGGADTHNAGDGGSDADSLEAYDLAEDVEVDSWQGVGQGPDGGTAAGGAGGMRGEAPLALRPLAAALRKADDVQCVLDALRRVEVLVRAMPAELPTYAPELVRSLLHCRVPEWAEVEAQRPADKPQGQRERALVALLACAPVEAGDQALSEVYSPHLDQYQRLLLLDTVCGAARQLADPRTAPRLVITQAGPQLVLPQRGVRSGAALPGATQRRPQELARCGGDVAGAALRREGAEPAEREAPAPGALAAPGLREASTRVWGPVALRNLRQQQKTAGGAGVPPQRRTWRNQFAPLALRWASALLRACDVRAQGVDLFGRDAILLGRLVTVLGTFMECVGEAPQALPLAAAVLELLRAPQVSGSGEPYVRRCALVAAAAVVSNLPAPRLAGALVGSRRDAADAALVERLQWLQGWAAAAAAGDGDHTCRVLAGGVLGMHAELANAAMEAAPLLPGGAAWDPLAAPDLASGAARRGARGLDVALPRLNELRLA